MLWKRSFLVVSSTYDSKQLHELEQLPKHGFKRVTHSKQHLFEKTVIYFLGFTVLVVLPTIPKKVASVGSKNPNHKKNTCCLLTGFFQVKPVKIALREYKKPEMVMKTERAFFREKCPLRLCLAVYGWIIVGCVWKEKSWWWKQEKARRKRVEGNKHKRANIGINN